MFLLQLHRKAGIQLYVHLWGACNPLSLLQILALAHWLVQRSCELELGHGN